MKQIYSIENFRESNYYKEGIIIETTLNKCAFNNLVVYFDKYRLAFKNIERIEFNNVVVPNLKLYVSYEKDKKQHYKTVQVMAKDFNEFKNEWIDFICDIFSEAFISKEP